MALSKTQKNYLIAGAIGIVTLAGALVYLQYQKLMQYVITFRSVRIKSITPTLFSFDIFLNFENKSNLSFKISSQSYDVYVNDVFVTRLSNSAETSIAANSVSPMGLNISFNPQQAWKKLGLNALTALKNRDGIIVKIDMKMRVKIGPIGINIPYVYQDSLKNMMGVGQPAV